MGTKNEAIETDIRENKEYHAHPSASMTCLSRSPTCIGSRGANRNRVHRDCSAGIILFT
jgi:hypothetical protein